MLAYFDSLGGLVPVRVEGVTTGPCPPTPDAIGMANMPRVSVTVTADRPGYRRGERFDAAPGRVVARDRVRVSGGHYRVRPRCQGDGHCARRAGHSGAHAPLTDRRAVREVTTR